MTFVNEVLGSQTAQRVFFPQLADSVDGLANGLQGRFFFGGNQLAGEHFFDIQFERYPSLVGFFSCGRVQGNLEAITPKPEMWNPSRKLPGKRTVWRLYVH